MKELERKILEKQIKETLGRHTVLRLRKDFVVDVGKTDYFGELRVSAWLEYIQDLATVHGKQLGVGFDKMYAENCFWVVSRICMTIFRQVENGAKISGVTVVHAAGKVECVRDFYFFDEQDVLIAVAQSSWSVIDTRTRRLKRASEYFPQETECFVENDCVESFRGKLNVGELSGFEKCYESIVRLSDADRNEHLNNVRYGDHVMNACGLDIMKEQRICGLDLYFKRELRIDDSFSVERLKTDNDLIVTISDEKGEVFASKVYLVKR